MVVVGPSAWLLVMTNAVLDVGSNEGSITPMFEQAELSMELDFLEQQQGQEASVACCAGQ